MDASYRVLVTVKDVMGSGKTSCGYRVGNTWTVTGHETIEGFCGWAFAAMLPFLTVLRFGGSFPWEPDEDTALVCCPDPHNPVVFELRRLPVK
ncbi:MAG: TIGR04076 family protein [bacterium]|jgi:uncharacterized repeat protein (TIGR04076 family)|nr:TIGR04076 family protein [bacterium]